MWLHSEISDGNPASRSPIQTQRNSKPADSPNIRLYITSSVLHLRRELQWLKPQYSSSRDGRFLINQPVETATQKRQRERNAFLRIAAPQPPRLWLLMIATRLSAAEAREA